MKIRNFVTVFVLGMMLAAASVNASDVRNEFKEYEIASVNDLHLGKNVKAVWTLSYSENESPVTVVKRKTVEGIEYVVQGSHFAISYAATAKGFGAKEVRNAWSNVPKKITSAVINKKEMAKQQVITPNKVDDERALGLIASYLPELLNDGYTHLLN